VNRHPLAVAFRTDRAEWQAVAMPTLDDTYHAPHVYMRLADWSEWVKVSTPTTRTTPHDAPTLVHYLHGIARTVEGTGDTTPNP
jgi:hypothetical protein